jgi:hypothetical protein
MRVRNKVTREWSLICDNCESPHVFTIVHSKYGAVELCYSCTRKRVPGYDIEMHHRTLLDHIDEKLKPDADDHLPGYYPKKETSR